MHKVHKIQKKANKSHINEGKLECSFIILCASLLIAARMNILIIRKATRCIWRWESTKAT